MRLPEGSAAGRAFFLPGLLLVLVALGGRYTLDRAGLLDLAWVDLRMVGAIVGIAVLAIDVKRRSLPHAPGQPWGTPRPGSASRCRRRRSRTR